MKRFLAAVIVLAMIFAFPIVSDSTADTTAKLGELLITSQKVSGKVGDVVRVDFYLYANLPEGKKLDALEAILKYDSDFVKFGAINQEDAENNLKSFMKGKASMFTPNTKEDGIIKLAYIDGYGVEANGFWFQVEFRIEKEGATDFVFNGIKYTGIDDSYKAESFYIEPVSVGGIYTEGQEEPTNGPVEETFAPLTPAVNTPAPVTPTPKPSHQSQPVPVTSSLPTYSAKPTPNGVVTPQPAVTSMPMTTNAGGDTAPQETDSAAQSVETTPEGNPDPIAELTTDAPTEPPLVVEEQTAAPAQQQNEGTTSTEASVDGSKTNEAVEEEPMNLPLVIGVLVGIAAVVGLGILAIVLILKRRNMSDADDDEEEEEPEQKPRKKKQ